MNAYEEQRAVKAVGDYVFLYLMVCKGSRLDTEGRFRKVVQKNIKRVYNPHGEGKLSTQRNDFFERPFANIKVFTPLIML